MASYKGSSSWQGMRFPELGTDLETELFSEGLLLEQPLGEYFSFPWFTGKRH